MSRRTRGQPATEVTQEDPTAPRPRSADGFELDQWGLPLSGPIRAQWLAEMGKPDPNEDPDAWEGATPLVELAGDGTGDRATDIEAAAKTEMNDGD